MNSPLSSSVSCIEAFASAMKDCSPMTDNSALRGWSIVQSRSNGPRADDVIPLIIFKNFVYSSSSGGAGESKSKPKLELSYSGVSGISLFFCFFFSFFLSFLPFFPFALLPPNALSWSPSLRCQIGIGVIWILIAKLPIYSNQSGGGESLSTVGIGLSIGGTEGATSTFESIVP